MRRLAPHAAIDVWRTTALHAARTLALFACAAALAAAPVPLVSNGAARASIVAASPGPIARKAADLLASRIRRNIGVALPVSAALPAGPAVVISAAGSPALTKLGITAPADLGDEGFTILNRDGRLYVIAREGRGLIYGAGKILRTARHSPGSMAADPPEGPDRPALPTRMLYLAIHADNFYEMQDAAVIHREVVEDMALWGVNGVWVWFDQSQYNDPFAAGLDNSAARARWNKEKQVLRLAQDLGLEPGYTTSDNDLYRNQATPAVQAPGTSQWKTFQALACPSIPAARALILRNKEVLARELADAGVRLRSACHFAYDTGGCNCDRCKPWVLTYLKLARDVHDTFAKYHPGLRSYMSDWHFTDEEARLATDFFNRESPAWFAGIFKDDRHPADRFAAVPPRYPVLTFLEITEIGAWGTVGANPFPQRLVKMFGDIRGAGQRGYVAYSEGIYDDFNKAAAARIAWDPAATPAAIAAEYANVFFTPAVADDFVRMIAGMESAWTNPMGSWGQQQFVQSAQDAAAVERLSASIAGRLPAAVRRHWRWQVFERRAQIGAAIAALNDPAAFRARIEEMVRRGEPRVETRRVMEAKRATLERYARLVTELRDGVYREPFTRYPPMIPGDWFMRARTRLDYAAWVQIFQDLSAVIDGIAKP